jgi:hypothetical protein
MERSLKVLQRTGWGLAGELRKFMNQMHLVVVAKPLRNLSPGTIERAGHPVQCTFEPRDARKQLEAEANFFGEYFSKLTLTQGGPTGHVRDAFGSSSGQHLMGRCPDSISSSRCTGALQEKLVGDRDPFIEGTAIGEPILQAHNPMTEHRFRIEISIGELLRGHSKQEIESIGLKHDSKRIDDSADMKLPAPGGLNPNQHATRNRITASATVNG